MPVKEKAKHVLVENLPKTEAVVLPGSQTKLGKPLMVVYIGALLPDRCCEDVIKAFSAISPETATCDFIGFGAPDYEARLKQILQELKEPVKVIQLQSFSASVIPSF